MWLVPSLFAFISRLQQLCLEILRRLCLGKVLIVCVFFRGQVCLLPVIPPHPDIFKSAVCDEQEAPILSGTLPVGRCFLLRPSKSCFWETV